MTLIRSAFVGAALMLGATAGASAQTQYVMPPQLAANPYEQAAPPAGVTPTPGLPPSMSYDPYTSGLGPCPERGHTDEQCGRFIAPTYGQPNYWPER